MPTTTTQIQGPNRTRRAGNCAPDSTPPPDPQIVRAMAFERASKRGTFTPYPPPPAPLPARRYSDPVYIELNNVEPGTRFRLLNTSKNPNGTFAKNGVVLEATGRDVANRAASIYLTEAQMKKIDLRPGDTFSLQALDEAGNASANPAHGQLDYYTWATGTVQDTIDRKPLTTRGTQLSALDGEGARKDLIVREVPDGRAPLVLMDRVTLKAGTNGAATLIANGAMEPGASLTVTNLRTSEQYAGSVAQDGTMSIELSNMAAGDPILLQPLDAWSNAGKDVPLTYAPKCRGGKAKASSPVATRLRGVI